MNIVYTYISIDPQFVTFGGVPIKLDSRCLGVESVPSLKTQTFNFLTLLGPSGEGEACQVESMKVWHLVRREDWFTCGIVRAAFVSIFPSRSTCCTITISLMKMTNRMINQHAGFSLWNKIVTKDRSWIMFIKYLFLELVKLLTGRVHRLVELHNLRLVFFAVWIFICEQIFFYSFTSWS